MMVMNYEAQEKRLPTKEEREAKKAKARWDAEQNLTARKKLDDAFRDNFANAINVRQFLTISFDKF